MEGSIVGIIGDRGAGKTLLLTSMLYHDWKAGKKIITNYKLQFGSTQRITYASFGEIAQLPEWIADAVIGMDELGEGADSREFFKKRNQNIGKLAMQIRKRRSTVVYTVQNFNYIDKRLRQQTDYLLVCYKHPDPNKVGARVTIVDPKTYQPIKKFDFDGNDFTELYDTYEIVTAEEDE